MGGAEGGLGVVEGRTQLQIDGSTSALHVALSLGDCGFSQRNLRLSGRTSLLVGLLLGAQRLECRVQSGLGHAQVLEGCERIARVRQGRLGLGDGRVSVGHHRVKHSRIRVQLVDIGDVRGNRADRRDEAIADRVQVGLRREDRVGLVVGHRQGA